MPSGKVATSGLARVRVGLPLSVVALLLAWPAASSAHPTSLTAPTPTPTRTSDSTASPSTSPSASASATPSRTVPPTTGKPTPTPTPTRTPQADPTPTPATTATKTPPPTVTPTATASTSPQPTATPGCAAAAPNLVQNPGFESVGVGTGFTGTVWEVLDTATTQVPTWTRTNTSANPPVVHHGGFGVPPAFQGAGFASLASNQGLLGTLSSPTNAGATYVLSAEILRTGVANPATLDVRLRNSATGAQSAPLVQAANAPPLTWVLLTGTVTGAAFDRVVVRHQAGGALIVDDVRVCRATVALPDPVSGWWTTPRKLAMAAVLGVILLGGLGWAARRRFRTRGRISAATVRG